MICTFLLAWRPFLDPINCLHDWWWVMLVPLAAFIAVIYKAIRMPNLRKLPSEAAVLAVQIVLGMIGLAIVIHVIAETATHSAL
ncbi:MAG: hypothetical protein KAS72_12755 [Phycisphaerales bacterium]|nr:hypothetical protein [Phycisphaerales bacterium]